MHCIQFGLRIFEVIVVWWVNKQPWEVYESLPIQSQVLCRNPQLSDEFLMENKTTVNGANLKIK